MPFATVPTPLYVTGARDTTHRPAVLYVTTSDLTAQDQQRLPLTSDNDLGTCDIFGAGLTCDATFIDGYYL